MHCVGGSSDAKYAAELMLYVEVSMYKPPVALRQRSADRSAPRISLTVICVAASGCELRTTLDL